MVWIILATLGVVFVVGFRVLTSDSRRAIKRLNERLGITPVAIESMIDQFGKTAGTEFIRYLERPDEAHLQNAAQVLLIWQVCIVDGSEENLNSWYRLLRKARLAAPITDAQIRLTLGFMREIEPDPQELNAFQLRYNQLFLPEEGGVLSALISRVIALPICLVVEFIHELRSGYLTERGNERKVVKTLNSSQF
ncbi:Protein of uncharacterised function (DUF1198) [Raoultella terrigena]|uniref:Protein of uncharacterized function (DUF1198) n=1 Tax=Raoultella terrigena TaxID=577 RepID=A0A485CTA1_RAOTE|nr:Protein of uncharacterised function (DUF1198) [Raoultella terrigena]